MIVKITILWCLFFFFRFATAQYGEFEKENASRVYYEKNNGKIFFWGVSGLPGL